LPKSLQGCKSFTDMSHMHGIDFCWSMTDLILRCPRQTLCLRHHRSSDCSGNKQANHRSPRRTLNPHQQRRHTRFTHYP
jgi:hypothetical protein